MQQPLGQFSHNEITKSSVVALYAGEDEDNHDLPLFLGKMMNVFDNNENDGDANESNQASEYLVEIHEYIQQQIMTANLQENTGRTTPMEREPRIQKPQQPRRSLRKSQ